MRMRMVLLQRGRKAVHAPGVHVLQAVVKTTAMYAVPLCRGACGHPKDDFKEQENR